MPCAETNLERDKKRKVHRCQIRAQKATTTGIREMVVEMNLTTPKKFTVYR